MNLLPHCENATNFIISLVSVSKDFSPKKTFDEVVKNIPFPKKPTEFTMRSLFKTVFSMFPVSMFHKLTEPSPDPLTIFHPSSEKLNEVTKSLCPSKHLIKFPESASHIFIFLSFDPLNK